MSIGKHNKESLLNDPHNDNVLYALGHKKPKPLGDIFEGEEELSADTKPIKKRGPPKNAISQQQADELKRAQLDKLLADQHQKFKDREKKFQTQGSDIFGGGVVGRYIS